MAYYQLEILQSILTNYTYIMKCEAQIWRLFEVVVVAIKQHELMKSQLLHFMYFLLLFVQNHLSDALNIK